ncbi:MAG: hypothetical protein OXN94_00075 [Chloroflexota bacterium]|nr:hypothetical protein [Chloroflexota bacterium]MDE2952166.1 hypothetical protein [Chloroflexota bacterium]
MKRRRRLRALEDLLTRAASNDFDQREYALFQLGLILDRSNLEEGDELAARALSREQLRLRLSSGEQEMVAERLSQLAIRLKESRASVIWTLGKVDGVVLLGPLLALIDAIGEQLSNEAAYQACCALGKCLEKEDGVSAAVRASLGDARLKTILDRWRQGGDKRLQMTAGRALALIEQLRL